MGKDALLWDQVKGLTNLNYRHRAPIYIIGLIDDGYELAKARKLVWRIK